MDAASILAALTNSAVEVSKLDAPSAAGVYAYFLADDAALPEISKPGSDALYVGLSSNLAQREFALGLEALHRFVAREPLHRVHECVFAVLALESEPVDPRL